MTDNQIQVARVPLQIENNRYYFMQSRRYPEDMIIERRYVNLKDIKFTEEELPKEVVRVRLECYSYWYHDNEDASIYVVSHEGKHGVFANLQAT